MMIEICTYVDGVQWFFRSWAWFRRVFVSGGPPCASMKMDLSSHVVLVEASRRVWTTRVTEYMGSGSPFLSGGEC